MTTEKAFSEQAELLKRLEENTCANANTAERSARLPEEPARRLEQLLASLHDDLRGMVSSQLSSADEAIKSHLDVLRAETASVVQSSVEGLHNEFDRTTRTFAEAAAGHEALIRREIDSFRAEKSRGLSEHRECVDRQTAELQNQAGQFAYNFRAHATGVAQRLATHDNAIQMLSDRLDELFKTLAKRSVFTGVNAS